MRELVKATKKICARCIYHQGVGSQPGKEQTNYNICCNYLAAEGHSRIFEDGKMLALRKAGWTYEKIADEMHCSAQTVINHIKEME